LASMADILANPVEICFGTFMATSTVPATTSLLTVVKIVTAPAAAPVSDLAPETHPPKYYDIVQGMERVISIMEEALQICERAQRSTQMASRHKTFPFGLRPPSDVYACQATRSPGSNLGGGSHLATSSPSSVHAAIHSMYRAPITRAHDIPSAAAGCGRRSTRSVLLPTPREPPHLRTAASSRRSRSMSPHDHGSILCRVLVVSESEPPRHGATDSERHVRSRATSTAPNAAQMSSAAQYLLALETFASSSRKRGCQRSTVPRPT
jgi:hypothetical protein